MTRARARETPGKATGVAAPEAILDELARLRTRLADLSASVLATTDGLVLAHDAAGIEPDSIAALTAAHFALATRFAQAVDHGDLRESVIECDRGYLTSYAAGPDALLTVVTSGNANLAMVHLEARRCVQRLVRILRVRSSANPRPQLAPQVSPPVPQDSPPVPQDSPPVPQDSPPVPLVRRTPMANLPANVRRRQAAG